MTPMCWFMDAAAPMTKTVEDCALVLVQSPGLIQGPIHQPKTGPRLYRPSGGG